MSALFASRLRTRLTLQQPVLNPDGGGGAVRTWQDVAEVWAEVLPLESLSAQSEVLQGDALRARVTHRVTIRYRDGVGAGMRFLLNGRALDILTVRRPEEQRKMLEIIASEEGGAP